MVFDQLFIRLLHLTHFFLGHFLHSTHLAAHPCIQTFPVCAGMSSPCAYSVTTHVSISPVVLFSCFGTCYLLLTVLFVFCTYSFKIALLNEKLQSLYGILNYSLVFILLLFVGMVFVNYVNPFLLTFPCYGICPTDGTVHSHHIILKLL